MEVTDVKVHLSKQDGAIKAFANITLDDAMVIHGLRIMEGKNDHLFVAYPARAKSDGTYEDVVFPITHDLADKIKNCIIGEYENLVEQRDRQEAENVQNEEENIEQSAANARKGRNRS